MVGWSGVTRHFAPKLPSTVAWLAALILFLMTISIEHRVPPVAG
jgi:hypothetical protein